ncbi:MAG: DUF1573 domain-containing protein [Chitinophagales bacterium]
MKKIVTSLMVALIATASFAQNSATPAGSSASGNPEAPAVNPNAGEFQWVEETHDFGTIPQGIPVEHKFEFTNVGKEPIIISNVQKTCGCTVTDWSKEQIMPGQKGFVSAQYNAAKEGPFTKAITVQSDAKQQNVKLYFKGTVEKSEQSGGVPENQNIFNSGGN